MTAISLAGASARAEAPPVQWGEIVYPLFGNIRSDEGTVLIRFQIDEPLDGKTGVWYQPKESWYRLIIARLLLSEESSLTFFWKSTQGRGDLWTAIKLHSFPQGSPNLKGGGKRWQTGEPHFVAYRWSRDGEHAWLADGKRADHMTSAALQSGLGRIGENKATLVLGGRRAHSAVTFFAVHILDRALGEDALQQSPAELFAPMDATLLLDRYDDERFVPDGKIETRAEVITGYCGERGGVPSPACRFVETPDGRGLRVFARSR